MLSRRNLSVASNSIITNTLIPSIILIFILMSGCNGGGGGGGDDDDDTTPMVTVSGYVLDIDGNSIRGAWQSFKLGANYFRKGC